MEKYGWYSVITDVNGKYDCILKGKLFRTEEECKKEIKKSKKEDKENGWKYKYSSPNILTIYDV